MKKIALLSILIASFSFHVCFGQESEFIGPRSNGVANSSSTFSDVFSIFNNPGSLGFVENESVASGYHNRFEMEAFSTAYAVVNKKIKSGFASLGISRFGDDLLSHSKIVTGYGNTLGIASIGGSITYHQLQIEGFGTKGFVTFDFGGVAHITHAIKIGALIKNISQAKISKHTEEKYPTLIIAGLSYMPTTSLTVNVQINKNISDPAQIKIGIEYKVKAIYLRSGFNTNPSWIAFGGGFHHKKFEFDYALQNHPLLGRSHTIALTYNYMQCKSKSATPY